MSERHRVPLLALVFLGLILVCLGKGFQSGPLVALGCLLAGTGCMAGMLDTQRGGVIRTNWGTTRRAEDPVGFHLECGFWWVVILSWTVAGVLHGVGILGK
jgi:hypothetical protein